MFNITEFTDHGLLSFFSLPLIHGSRSSADDVGDLGYETLVDPKEVIGVIAPKTDQLENVVNGFGCNAGEEPEFNVPKIGLQTKPKIQMHHRNSNRLSYCYSKSISGYLKKNASGSE